MGKIDPEEVKTRAAELAGVVAEKANEAFSTASELTKVGVRAAKPKVIRAADATVKTASPWVDSAVAGTARLTERAGEGLHRVHKDLVDEYLPRLNQAVEEAVSKVADAIPADNLAVVEAAKPKKHRVRKIAGWTVAAAGVAGVAYILWRRSRPVEDPWAEEYWTDLETDVDLSATPDESLSSEQQADAEVAADTAAIAVGEETAEGDEN